MAEWKKVVVSGSAVSQLNNDSGYLVSGQSSEVTLSGSFSGSFQGDGSNLSGITADTLGNSLTDGNGIADFSFNGSAAASVAVEADGSTLSVGASGVKVADAGITETQLNTSVAGDGLSGGAGTALSVNTDGTSITTSGDNLTLAGTTFSSSVDSRIDAVVSDIAGLDSTYATDASVSAVAATASAANTALSASITTTTDAIASNVSTNASSISTIESGQNAQNGRLDAIETFTGSLDNNFATDTELSSLSASAATARGVVASDAASANTTLSASIATTTDDIASDVSTNAGNISTNASGISTNASSITSLSGSAATARATVASDAASANTTLSASIATTTDDIASDVSTNAGNISTNASSITSLSGSAATARGVVASDAASANTTLSSSIATTTDALGTRVGSLESDSHVHANKANLDQINQDLGTTDDVTFNDVVVSGDLTVSGTTTTLNTTNLLVEDKFILLNSGSADPDEGGLIIDEGAGSGHAFIYDKGDTRWGFNASVASDASTANATAHVAAVVDIQNVAHSDSSEYQKNGNIKIDSGDIFIYC